ncbi:hypothetical protein HMPREF9296_0953 [Prevotella disiens FB035-09AN]|uniref:Uncharacterized protein n=1 Tax=Prevotella disiens FB035-09AN TaxID=866771 RepID=E1KQM8_9BACT|nr:hypothetical protein HMPREF9296_0953 [Prevotella disiens FB035-09AN]
MRQRWGIYSNPTGRDFFALLNNSYHIPNNQNCTTTEFLRRE